MTLAEQERSSPKSQYTHLIDLKPSAFDLIPRVSCRIVQQIRNLARTFFMEFSWPASHLV